MPPTTRSQTRSSVSPLRCRLLELPAELRNYVYELAFSTDNDADEEIDLLTASPPSKALLLACHQVHDEAHQIFRDSYRTFWTTSHFYANATRAKRFYTQLAQCKDEGIEHIHNLEIEVSTGYRYTMLERQGEWYTELLVYRRTPYMRWGYNAYGYLDGHNFPSLEALRAGRDRLSRGASFKQQLLDVFGNKPT